MHIVYSPEHQQHAPDFEVYEGVPAVYAEQPERVETIRDALVAAGYPISPPDTFDDEHLLAVHARRYVAYLQAQSDNIRLTGEAQRTPSNHIMDLYAPMTEGTYQAARTAANVALTAASLVTQGLPAYGLCRPPGHHAGSQVMGGYCYFNNASIAAEYLARRQEGVAILDIDFHHGNGTQEIFYDRDDVLYVSLHADPDEQYPYVSGREEETGRGQGEGCNMNIVLPRETAVDDYVQALDNALDRISDFDPGSVVLSLGFDTYVRDPIAGFDLHREDYARIGQRIGQLEQPTVLIQEGGYYIPDLGRLAVNFLSGYLEQKA